MTETKWVYECPHGPGCMCGKGQRVRFTQPTEPQSDNLPDVAETIEHAKRLQRHSAVSVPEHASEIGILVSLLESLSARVTQAETTDDGFCREENCTWRHWRSGSMPTHRRGSDCPEMVPATGNEASE